MLQDLRKEENMTEQQLHHEVKEYESLLNNVYPVNLKAKEEELSYISEIEKEMKKELGVSKLWLTAKN